MSLATLKEVLTAARKGGYAVGAFEVWNLESVQAVVRGAEKFNQPVIIQSGPCESEFAELGVLSLIMQYYAKKAKVPVVLHLDHGDTFERVMEHIQNGYTSVMLDVSHLPFEENVAATKEVVRAAHACGISVEGELGRIGGEEAGIDVNEDDSVLTDPEHAAEYVERTGIDALAVAIGTVHGFYKKQPKIRLELLEKIAKRVSIPLVLHGGSGTPDEVVKRAIGMGIAKVNVCTEFVAAFSDAQVKQRSKAEFKFNVPGVFEKPRAAGQKIIEDKIRLFAGLK